MFTGLWLFFRWYHLQWDGIEKGTRIHHTHLVAVCSGYNDENLLNVNEALVCIRNMRIYSVVRYQIRYVLYARAMRYTCASTRARIIIRVRFGTRERTHVTSSRISESEYLSTYLASIPQSRSIANKLSCRCSVKLAIVLYIMRQCIHVHVSLCVQRVPIGRAPTAK